MKGFTCFVFLVIVAFYGSVSCIAAKDLKAVIIPNVDSKDKNPSLVVLPFKKFWESLIPVKEKDLAAFIKTNLEIAFPIIVEFIPALVTKFIALINFGFADWPALFACVVKSSVFPQLLAFLKFIGDKLILIFLPLIRLILPKPSA